ncbi:nuclear transport factor 2 family protein [Confluentibacter sediminis]|uniref:nuclear transport factor 2 family protein n=1 Tax=Confluentibacter sediminis TaxID=2219045 RepID=UPI000DAC3256|nr:ester cyclase [Confluentibacter sediminis]
MTKKDIASSFLKLAGLGNVQEAYDKFVDKDFIHHNQYFKGDRESLKLAMEDAHKTQPNTFIDIKSCYQDGDTVITHSHVGKEAMAIAVVHMFRFEQDKIVELWDLGQVIDKDSPNEHGAF